jgi:hypothetical protein
VTNLFSKVVTVAGSGGGLRHLVYVATDYDLPWQTMQQALGRQSINFIQLQWGVHETADEFEMQPVNQENDENVLLLFQAAVDVAYQCDRYRLTASSFPWRAQLLAADNDELRTATCLAAEEEWARVLQLERESPHILKRCSVTRWQSYREIMLVLHLVLETCLFAVG